MSNDLIILTAIGARDRPGIIAALTGAVLELGGNLDDATMTRLHGAFATMIAARIDRAQLPAMRGKLDKIGAELELHVALEILDDGADSGPAAEPADHIITVYGVDHPGIVHHVAKLLQAQGANITDLKTRLSAGPGAGGAIYVMMVETAGGNWDDLPGSLLEFGRAQNVDVSYSVIDEETL